MRPLRLVGALGRRWSVTPASRRDDGQRGPLPGFLQASTIGRCRQRPTGSMRGRLPHGAHRLVSCTMRSSLIARTSTLPTFSKLTSDACEHYRCADNEAASS